MKIPLKFISSLSFLAFFSCCALLGNNSLWLKPTTSERGMFADRVAYRIGDILMITLNESTIQENSLETTHNKNATILGSVVSFLFPAANTSFGKHNGALPSTNIALSNDDYTGKGKIKNASKLVAKASVSVIDVLPNGNLVIKGTKSVRFSDEKEQVVLTGVVRPYDIQKDNTVDFSKISHAEVNFYKEGAISSAQKKGWLLRLKDFINPF